MIIVWRGWGAGAFGLLLLGMMLGGMAVSITRDNSSFLLGAGVGLIIAGVAVWFLGTWLNVTRPAARIEEHLGAVREHLWERVRAGQFQVSPGAPAPRTEPEAQVQVEQIVAGQRGEVERALRNRNTLFWIPMQYWAPVGVIGGVVMLVAWVLGRG